MTSTTQQQTTKPPDKVEGCVGAMADVTREWVKADRSTWPREFSLGRLGGYLSVGEAEMCCSVAARLAFEKFGVHDAINDGVVAMFIKLGDEHGKDYRVSLRPNQMQGFLKWLEGEEVMPKSWLLDIGLLKICGARSDELLQRATCDCVRDTVLAHLPPASQAESELDL